MCWLVVWAEFLVSYSGETKMGIVSLGVARTSVTIVSNQVGISPVRHQHRPRIVGRKNLLEGREVRNEN